MATLDFEVVNKLLGDKLFTKASIMSRGNHTFAEEAVQETLVSAWMHQDQFDGKNLAGWLTTILRNKIIDARRLKRSNGFLHNSININEDGALKEGFKALTVYPADPEQVDVVWLVARAIRSLPKEYASLCKMRFLDEMPIKDIAEKTDLPVGTVMSRLFRITPVLRQTIEKALSKG